ncbi:MAG: hypothetical protein Q9162_006696 [Coniocarpon cinnabarinum]
MSRALRADRASFAKQEKVRMDMLHTILLEARRNELHRAPVQNDKDFRILDLGTGTGIWAIDMAEMPDNLRFNVGIDYLNPWSFGLDSWNLIHLRQALGSVQSWPNLYQKIFSHLKPGVGYIEQIEVDLEPRCDDGTMPEAPLKQWYEYLKDATSRVGRPIAYNHDTREMLERAGFVEIQESVFRAPFNTWPRDTHLKAIGRRHVWVARRPEG